MLVRDLALSVKLQTGGLSYATLVILAYQGISTDEVTSLHTDNACTPSFIVTL